MNDKLKPTLGQVFMSVLGAMFGVQSKKNLERDFQYGTFSQYAIIGGLFSVAFVFAVWGVVGLVMNAAGV
ncbi:MAG TPA: DUF2970 domain-containing protein [Chromatiaceae bacterium]|jgi:hypothetical protein|nr:DUF2970 domain-containing protein [Chromatiaceae bacterium]HIA09272.1 DUF2970 domain-containing protein [Chromatiaceae bacterium]HIN83168.1 DUF2970 domain-containing protein [Chromatiales bacterium]HIO54427.1 DUF2970 domain-containing protein [Chromatiales bacterium]